MRFMGVVLLAALLPLAEVGAQSSSRSIVRRVRDAAQRSSVTRNASRTAPKVSRASHRDSRGASARYARHSGRRGRGPDRRSHSRPVRRSHHQHTGYWRSYYEAEWVPPVYRFRRNIFGGTVRVLIRKGYYRPVLRRVWVTTCRHR